MILEVINSFISEVVYDITTLTITFFIYLMRTFRLFCSFDQFLKKPSFCGSIRKMSEMMKFHKWDIDPSQIFFRSEHCYGLINLKPITPGDNIDI